MDKIYLALMLMVSLAIFACGSTSSNNTVQHPNLNAEQVIAKAGQRMLNLNTARFNLGHEAEESTNLFPGVDMTLIEGRVEMPNTFDVHVEGMTTFPFPKSFIEIQIISVAGKTYMTDIFVENRWNEISPDTLPFNFSNLGKTLSDIILAMDDPTLNGVEEVDSVRTIRVLGTVPSEVMKSLIPNVWLGLEVGLEFWIGESDGWLYKASIDGSVFDSGVNTAPRVLMIYDFNANMDINLPTIR